MSISQAIRTVVKAQKMGGSTIGLVRKLWSSLSLSDSDITVLAQQSLASRVNAFHTGPKEAEENYQPPYREPSSHRSESEPRIIVDVVKENIPEQIINVEVRVLHTTNYDINGHRKPFIMFTLYDARYSMDRYQQQIEGHTRHFKLMKCTRELLAKRGKNTVAELSQNDQTALARKLRAAIQGQEEEAA